MNLPRRLALALILPVTAQAQTRTIRIVVPFAAGAAADNAACSITPRMAEHLGQTIVVENRIGADHDLGPAGGPGAPGPARGRVGGQQPRRIRAFRDRGPRRHGRFGARGEYPH